MEEESSEEAVVVNSKAAEVESLKEVEVESSKEEGAGNLQEVEEEAVLHPFLLERWDSEQEQAEGALVLGAGLTLGPPSGLEAEWAESQPPELPLQPVSLFSCV